MENPIVDPPGHGRRSLLLDFSENLSERLVAQRLVGEPELDRVRLIVTVNVSNANNWK